MANECFSLQGRTTVRLSWRQGLRRVLRWLGIRKAVPLSDREIYEAMKEVYMQFRTHSFPSFEREDALPKHLQKDDTP